MRFKQGHILFLLILLLLASCETMHDADVSFVKAPNQKSQVYDVLMPLKTGNYWVYQITNYDTGGNLTNQYLDTLKVVEKVFINNEDWYKTIRTSNGDIRYYRNTDTAIVEYCDNCVNQFTPLGYYPLELEFGRQEFEYTKHLDNNNSELAIVKVYTILDTIDIPYSYSLNCYFYMHYYYDNKYGKEEDALDYWYKSNLGLVKLSHKKLFLNNYYLYEIWELFNINLF